MACVCGHGKENYEKYLAPLNEVFARFGREQDNLIPILQEAQEKYGYLPQDVLSEIAENLGLPLSKVYGVVTFYSQFHLEPRAKM